MIQATVLLHFIYRKYFKEAFKIATVKDEKLGGLVEKLEEP